MSRVQILDVGDAVRILDSSDGLRNREGVLIRVVGERHVVAVPGLGQMGGYKRSDLERVGDDLQVGDFVSCEGSKGILLAFNPHCDEWLFVWLEGMLRHIRDATTTYHLTRISRAEALA